MLDIKPFFKPTNKSSAHPRNIFKSLIKGELTRLLRACSDKETFENVSNKLLKALAERGYPNQLLQDTLQQVPFERRTKILEGKEKEEIKYDTFFKIDYTPDLNTKKLRQIIQPHKDEGSNIPHPCVSLKKKDNLAKKKLVCAKLKGFKPPPSSTTPITIEATKPKKKIKKKSIPCKNHGCKCCNAISNKCRVTSTHNYKTFPTQKYLPKHNLFNRMYKMFKKEPICRPDFKTPQN